MAFHPGESALLVRLANAGRDEVPPRPPGDGPPLPPVAVGVFGVGTDRVQVTWRVLGPGAVTVAIDGAEPVSLHADGGPGAVTVGGLAPATATEVRIDGPGVLGGPIVLRARTLERPPGALLHHIATVTDPHLGSTSTGYLHTMVEKPPAAVPHAMRCLSAALDEQAAWGADRLVVKGDLVDRSSEENWSLVRDVLEPLAIPIHAVPGNHEHSTKGDVDPTVGLATAGVTLGSGVTTVDVDGLRLVLVDTVVPGSDVGSLAPLVGDAVDAAGGTDDPVLVAMHHQPMRFRLPTYLPPGVPGPEARRFLSGIGRANPRALVTAGHTHRHRRRDHGTVTVVEVGSTKDYPGSWAGYEVYEGGIVQVVHRIERGDCIRWTDHTRRAALGLWARWSPGSLEDRCFTRTW